MRYEAVIFDMDGIIVDSEPVYLKWLKDFLAGKGIQVGFHELSNLVGISQAAGVAFIKAKCGSEEKANVLWKEYLLECEEYPLNYNDILIPGVKALITALSENGKKLGMASSSSMEDIGEVLSETKLRSCFDVILSGEMFKESKPNPEIYIRTAEKLHVPIGQCIVIEDSSYGILAGKRAGAYVIAREETRFEFDQSMSDLILPDMNEIERVVKGLLEM
ncbi:MAG: HAD family phosphatase [Lachnospiraceae bacterium]|nr:HAD family phosphatase [Lachnospiraceae bacterium]